MPQVRLCAVIIKGSSHACILGVITGVNMVLHWTPCRAKEQNVRVEERCVVVVLLLLFAVIVVVLLCR